MISIKKIVQCQSSFVLFVKTPKVVLIGEVYETIDWRDERD